MEVEAILDRLNGKPEESARTLAEAMAIAKEFAGDNSPAYRRAELERMLSLSAADDLNGLRILTQASQPEVGGPENPVGCLVKR